MSTDKHRFIREEYEYNGERTVTFKCACGRWSHDRYPRDNPKITLAKIKERHAEHAERASR